LPKDLQAGIADTASDTAGCSWLIDANGCSAVFSSVCKPLAAALSAAVSDGSTAANLAATAPSWVAVDSRPVLSVPANWAPPSKVGGAMAAKVDAVDENAVCRPCKAPTAADCCADGSLVDACSREFKLLRDGPNPLQTASNHLVV
jgi:hypothetical protein